MICWVIVKVVTIECEFGSPIEISTSNNFIVLVTTLAMSLGFEMCIPLSSIPYIVKL